MSDSTNNHEHDDKKVQSDKLKLLYHQSFPAVFYSFLVALMYAWILRDHADKNALLVWLGVMVLSSITRLFLFLIYRRQDPQEQELLKWERP